MVLGSKGAIQNPGGKASQVANACQAKIYNPKRLVRSIG